MARNGERTPFAVAGMQPGRGLCRSDLRRAVFSCPNCGAEESSPVECQRGERGTALAAEPLGSAHLSVRLAGRSRQTLLESRQFHWCPRVRALADQLHTVMGLHIEGHQPVGDVGHASACGDRAADGCSR